MKFLYVVLLFLGISLSGCSHVAQVQLVGFKADSLNPEVRYNLLSGISQKVGEDSLFTKEIPDKAGEYFRLDNLVVFLKPGDQLTITSRDKSFTFTGTHAKENEWLNQSALRSQSLVSSVKRNEFAKLSLDEYKQIVGKDAAALRATLEALSDKDFKANAEERIAFLEMDAYVNYYSALSNVIYHEKKNEMMRANEHRKYTYHEAEDVIRERTKEQRLALQARIFPEVEKKLAAMKGTADIDMAEAQQLLLKLAMINEDLLMRNGYEAFCEVYRVNDFLMKKGTQVYSEKAGELERTLKDPYLQQVVADVCADFRHLQPGKEATDCVLETVDGKRVKLSDLKGKPILIDLWYVACAPCRQFMPVFDAVAKEYKDKGITFLSLSTDRKREEWINFKKENKSPDNMVLWRDANSEFTKAYLVTSAPRVILIDENFKIVNAQILERKEAGLKALLDVL